MESIQRRLSYLILTFALVSPLISWAQFDLASSAHTDITCNNIDEGITNDGTITLTFDAASSARGKTVVWWKFNGTAYAALTGGSVPTAVNNPAGGGNVGATSIQARNLGVGYYYAVITGASGEVETSPTFLYYQTGSNIISSQYECYHRSFVYWWHDRTDQCNGLWRPRDLFLCNKYFEW